MLSVGLALAAYSGSNAQDINSLLQPGPKVDCPPSGYYPPRYGVIGRNAGDGSAPTEAVSPCTPEAVVKAADAVGMARSHFFSPLSVKAVVTAMFTATGTLGEDGKTASKIDKADFHIHYGLPAVRLMVQRAGKLEIDVMNDDYGWTEVTQGGAATPAMNNRRELLAMTKLTPFGALWSVIEAEGHAKVTTVQGKTVLQGTSPYDGMAVTVTLNADNRPEAVTVVDGPTTYTGAFADYRDDFESTYLFVFPKRLTWTRNG